MSEDRRVLTDPVFKHLVETFHRGMKEYQFTPTDVREALLQASILIERERPFASSMVPIDIAWNYREPDYDESPFYRTESEDKPE